MELRLKWLHDDERNFVVRICMTVADAKYIAEPSEKRTCEECDAEVWYYLEQVVPAPLGVDIEREVVLCHRCGALHMSQDPNAQWAD
jgi:uncharacterized protein with PIN domain